MKAAAVSRSRRTVLVYRASIPFVAIVFVASMIDLSHWKFHSGRKGCLLSARNGKPIRSSTCRQPFRIKRTSFAETNSWSHPPLDAARSSHPGSPGTNCPEHGGFSVHERHSQFRSQIQLLQLFFTASPRNLTGTHRCRSQQRNAWTTRP
jgi:hypothetical protein